MGVSQMDTVLTLLRDAGRFGVTNDQFLSARITRHSARVAELREQGHTIQTKCVDRSRGIWKTTLIHDAASNLNPAPEPERTVFTNEMFPDRTLNLEDVA